MMPDPHAQDATRAEIERLAEMMKAYGLKHFLQVTPESQRGGQHVGPMTRYPNDLAEWLYAHGVRLAVQPPGAGERETQVEELAVILEGSAPGWLREEFEHNPDVSLNGRFWTAFAMALFDSQVRVVPASGGSTEPRFKKGDIVEIDQDGTVELAKAGYVDAAPEPSAPAPCPVCKGDGSWRRPFDANCPRAREHPAGLWSVVAPCCPSCAAVREAALIVRNGVAVGPTSEMFRGLSALEDAFKQPCAGRAGAPRKEE